MASESGPAATPDRVAIAEVTRANWRDALGLAVAPEQQRFIADYAPIAALGLAKAYIRPGGLLWTPYVFSARDLPGAGVEGALIGFAMLAHQPEDSAVCWILHFFIDQRYQGQGYGALALRALLALIRQRLPDCSTVQLTVHPENQRAQRLYRGAGFRETGEQLDGEPLYALRWEPARPAEPGDKEPAPRA